MKYAILLFLVIGLPATMLRAQPRTKVTINAATVFLNGAELSSNAKISLPQGESDIILTNIAGNVNQQSLSIGAENGVLVQSATFQNNYLGDSTLSPRAKLLKDSLTALQRESESLSDRKTVIEEQLSVLKENRKVSGQNTGLSVAELQKLLDVLNVRMNTLLTARRELTTRSGKVEERIALVQLQFDEEQKKTYQPGGQLLVKFYAPQATSTNIVLTYVVPNAGWTPAYDLRVDKVNDPVKLFYKANIYQNSGVKWNNVRLTLSTGNPNEGAEAPVLSPYYLSFYERVVMAAGRVNTAQRYEMKMKSADAEMVAAAPSSLNEVVTVNTSGIHTNFEIDLPYTIPTDGQEHTVAIKMYELPATYRYVAVPKLDNDAFLQAQVTKWEDLNLLPATTNIFFEGSYVGQGYIDMRNVRDTMNLSLGRDKKIIVRRDRDKNLHSQKTIGTNERQSFAYTISVRNTRKEQVHLVVMDQLPVSNDKDIMIEDIETPGATYEETTGAVSWSVDLKPSELRKLQLSYTVKYPKGKTINNLR